MQRILVVSDHDDEETAAVDKGFLLASLTGAALEVVDFCFVKLDDNTQEADTTSTELQKSIIEKKKKLLEAVVEKARSKNDEYQKIEVSMDVIWEKYLYKWVAKRTTEESFDLIVKTGHRSESLFHIPTDWHLFRECKVPVYLRSEKSWEKKRRVLIALDVQGKDMDDNNKLLLEQGRKYADLMGAELDCCFVVHADVSKYNKLHKEEEMHLSAVKLIEPYGLTEENVFLESGDPEHKIVEIAEKLKVDCVIMGSAGRTGVKGKLIGNTAEHVIRNLRTDMLVMNLT
jgi:universal stress protein E